MYLLVLFLPILNIFFSGFFGRLLGRNSFYFIILNMVLACFISFLIFYEVGFYDYTCFVDLGEWLHIGVLRLNWVFLFDGITSVMLLLVTFISCLVHIYSLDYMSGDPHLNRFMSYLSLFTFFMLILITSGNFIQMFLG
jgi:NADH:ubiquinone oxidoreductase subunit 5 (subunit L)/multisubunit Na+/H+ antiporter MnhA subunit